MRAFPIDDDQEIVWKPRRYALAVSAAVFATALPKPPFRWNRFDLFNDQDGVDRAEQQWFPTTGTTKAKDVPPPTIVRQPPPLPSTLPGSPQFMIPPRTPLVDENGLINPEWWRYLQAVSRSLMTLQKSVAYLNSLPTSTITKE